MTVFLHPTHIRVQYIKGRPIVPKNTKTKKASATVTHGRLHWLYLTRLPSGNFSKRLRLSLVRLLFGELQDGKYAETPLWRL